MKKKGVPYLLLTPALLIMAVTIGFPILYNVYGSLFDWRILQSITPINFVGLGNYLKLIQSKTFWNSVFVTLKFTIIAVCLEFVFGLGLALLLNGLQRGRRFFQAALILPIMATPLVVGLMWRLMWHDQFGVVNYLISLIGIDSISWLAKPIPAFIALTITEVWQNTSFVFLMLFAALHMLPSEPYEAAIVDGASYWQQVRHITLPLLRSAIMVALMFRFVFTIRLFDQVWALTRGGPRSATMTLSMLIYKTGFKQYRTGHASTLSMMLLFLTAILTFFWVKTLYRSEE